MSILRDILKEEYDRLSALREKYSNELQCLPKGSISAKKRNNKNYYYLAYRVGNKVKFKYVGKENSDSLKALKVELSKRKELEIKLIQINKQINELSKSINEK